MVKQKAKALASRAVHRTLVSVGSIGATLLLFFLLPVINKIAGGERADTLIIPVDTAEIPPPDVVEEEEDVEEEEPEEEEPPPELAEEAEPLDLAQLEMALNAELAGGAGLGGDFTIDLSKVTGKSGGLDELFAASELDGKPQVTSQMPPSLSKAEKKATPGKVVVIFIVDKNGRVADPRVQKSSNQALNNAAIRTIKKWRFRPGTREGEPVRFRMRVPMTFPDQK